MVMVLQRTILNLRLAIWALSRGLAMGLRLAARKPILNLGLALGDLNRLRGGMAMMTVQGVEVLEVLDHGGSHGEMAKYKEPTRRKVKMMVNQPNQKRLRL